MSIKSYHIIANLKGGWNVIRTDAERATKSFATQKEAIEFGRSLSRNHDTELIIHERNGRLADKIFFGKDPNLSEQVRNH